MFRNLLAKTFLFLGISFIVHPTTTPAPKEHGLSFKNITQEKMVASTTAPQKSITASTKTTSAQKTIKQASTTTQVKKTEIPPPSPVAEKPTISLEKINETARKAVVNILCTTKSEALSPITGTGIVISDDGLILTNAHVAQYFLLKDFNNQKDFLSCIIRTGNPAYPTYKAQLVYISPAWVRAHKGDIILQNPQSTGEYDYAFLRITERTDGSEKPSSLPFLPINLIEYTEIGTPTVLVSYPAGFLGGQTILQSLYQSSAITTVSDRYTFGENTVDLISVGGSVVAQKGSSGGAVVDQNGTLIGIISTTSEGNTTTARDLHAITPAYIERDLIKETGETINSLSLKNALFAETFNANTAPELTKALSDVILKKQ